MSLKRGRGEDTAEEEKAAGGGSVVVVVSAKVPRGAQEVDHGLSLATVPMAPETRRGAREEPEAPGATTPTVVKEAAKAPGPVEYGDCPEFD
jgi:hypothetical protein